EILDAFAGAGPSRAEFAGHFRKMNALIAEHEALSASEASLEREIDLLKHQVAEINSAKLNPDEEEPLLARYSLASNSRRLIEISTQILQRLADADNAALPRLAESQRLLRELEKIDPAAADLGGAHASAVAEL